MKKVTTLENKVKRELPDDLMNKMDLKPFETTEIGHPEVKRVAPKVRVTTGQDKVVASLDDVIKNNLKDGMTISFHHHFRNGDYIFNMVMDCYGLQGFNFGSKFINWCYE